LFRYIISIVLISCCPSFLKLISKGVFKQRLLELGAEYSKTGTGKVQEDVLKI
jgi:hypothetical protein